MTPRRAVAALLALLVSACNSPTKIVRLTSGQGAPIVHVARADVEPVEVDDDSFKQSLIAHGRSVQPFTVPLVEARRLWRESSHPEPYSHVRGHLGLVSVGSASETPRGHLLPELAPAAAELKRCYLQWCDRTWGEGDCLRLLVDRPALDNDGKYTLAMAIAQRHVLEGMKESFGEMVNPTAVYASITSAMTLYLLLWTLPEPVSKGLAATLTVGLMAYLGVDTVWRLIDGWLVLVREVDRATTFDEIAAAGEKYGKTMGRTAAKAFVMLATVAVGNTAAGMAARLPTLPGARPAAALAETQLKLRYAAASQVEAVTVSAEGATLTLAPGAVAMAARGTGSSNNNSVYRSVNSQGQVQYVGLTNDVARRAVEHLRQSGFEIDKLLGNLSRKDARAVEQALIEIHGLGKNGGTLLNRINSLARTRPDFAALLRRGQELLQSIGYRVE
jgi:hypothetical protein